MRCPGWLIRNCLTCLKMNKKDRMLYKNNLRQLEKEIHVTYIIQTIRSLKAAIRSKFTKEEWSTQFRHIKRLDGHYSDEDGSSGHDSDSSN